MLAMKILSLRSNVFCCDRAVLFGLALMGLLLLARSADPPKIDYINKTNGNKVDIHFSTEANRSYILQAINLLSCGTNQGICNSNRVITNGWTNLLPIFAAPLTGHYIYRDTLTNKARFYRLQATP